MINLKFENTSEPINLEFQNNSGSGGTSNYPDLLNKPSINDVELVGNKTASELGLVDETTYKALEEIVAKKLNDILVNGNTIVDENGVANIPVLDGTNIGLVKLYEKDNNAGHLFVNTSGPRKGCLSLNTATENTVNHRWGNPLGANMLDYAVKQALTDGKGAEYTPTEKAMARSRLGIDTYELITDITTEEEVSKINIELLKDYKSLKFYFIVPKVESANGIRIVNKGINIGFAPSNNVSISATRHILIDIDVYSGYGTVSISNYGTSAMAVGSPNSNYNDRDTLINEKVEVFLGNISFPIGTNIKVWGDK